MKNISGGMETIEHVRKVLYDPEAPELSFILEYLNTIQGNVEAENRDEDPEWFEGVIGNHKTKQAVMRHGAKGRIRGYYYNCKDLIDGSVSKDLFISFLLFNDRNGEVKHPIGRHR